MNTLSPQDKKTLDNFNGMTVGQIFIRARQKQNATLEQVAQHLNISFIHLQAIEHDDVNALPPRVYAVGFVRAYADLLQLDSEKMAYLFKVQSYGKKQTDYQKKIVRPENKTIEIMEIIMQKADMIPMLLVSVFGIVLMCFALVVFVIWIIGGDENKRVEIPQVPEAMKIISQEEVLQDKKVQNEDELTRDENFDLVAGDVLDDREQSPNAQPFKKPEAKITVNLAVEPMDLILKPDDGGAAYGAKPLDSVLAFKIKQDVWAEFRALKGGKVLISQNFKAGDVLYIPKDMDVLVTTGNGGAIDAYLDNRLLGAVGKKSETVRLQPYSVEALRLQ